MQDLLDAGKANNDIHEEDVAEIAAQITNLKKAVDEDKNYINGAKELLAEYKKYKEGKRVNTQMIEKLEQKLKTIGDPQNDQKKLADIKKTEDEISKLKQENMKYDNLSPMNSKQSVDGLQKYFENSAENFKKTKIQAQVKFLEKKESQALKTDVCFLIDGTGGMRIWVKKLSQTIRSCFTMIKSVKEGFSYRISVVVYRDHSEPD